VFGAVADGSLGTWVDGTWVDGTWPLARAGDGTRTALKGRETTTTGKLALNPSCPNTSSCGTLSPGWHLWFGPHTDLVGPFCTCALPCHSRPPSLLHSTVTLGPAQGTVSPLSAVGSIVPYP
jgi:hypothetical protein